MEEALIKRILPHSIEAEQSVISDTIPPLTFAICRESFSLYSGVFTTRQILFNPRFNHLHGISVKFFKFFFKSRSGSYNITHMSSSFQKSEIGLLSSPLFLYSS